MVTAVTGIANSASSTVGMHDHAQAPVLSDLAQATLDRLGQMHADFTQSANAVDGRAQNTLARSGTPATESTDLIQSLESVSEAFRTATVVQSQIVQFSMATSISQSLGNNLNSFLKGT